LVCEHLGHCLRLEDPRRRLWRYAIVQKGRQNFYHRQQLGIAIILPSLLRTYEHNLEAVRNNQPHRCGKSPWMTFLRSMVDGADDLDE